MGLVSSTTVTAFVASFAVVFLANEIPLWDACHLLTLSEKI
jgi:hypothetical protein